VNGSDGDARPDATTVRATPPLPQLVVELRDLIVEYFKQETLVPLKQLGRYVAYGVLGALLLGFGAVFLGLAGLRAIQTETGTALTGNWSWVPYVIVVAALLLAGGIIWQARGAVRRRNDRKGNA
jgi:Putative Actinobacterial Holin-X, holin superfamily III